MDRNRSTRRLTKEIYNEFNNINFSLENLTSKLECLKMIERKYNESISDEILLLRLLPTFRGQKNRFFFYLTKFEFIILSIVSKRKILKNSKSRRVI